MLGKINLVFSHEVGIATYYGSTLLDESGVYLLIETTVFGLYRIPGTSKINRLKCEKQEHYRLFNI